MPEIGLVTVFNPLTTTGAGETAVQLVGEGRFVEDCKAKSVRLVDHVRITLLPAELIASCGGAAGSIRLNTEP